MEICISSYAGKVYRFMSMDTLDYMTNEELEELKELCKRIEKRMGVKQCEEKQYRK